MSPRRRDSFAWWEYAIMAMVGLLILGGAVLLVRVVTSSSESDRPVSTPSTPVPALGCADDEWFDQAAESCVPRATCDAGQVYDDRTNTCTLAAPVAAELTPRSGPPAGGTEITLVGIGFQPGATVTVNGVPAADVTVVDSSTITARTPASGVFYPVDVTVLNPDGQSDVLDNVFTYEEPQVERITEIIPDTGASAGGEAVLVKGRDFVPGAVVSFNGRPATDVQVLNDTTIRAVIPSAPVGPASVNVRNPGEQAATLRGGFEYVDRAPRIVESVRPAEGPAAGDTRITIRGSGFEPGASVSIGGQPARQVDVLSSTRITARTPAGDVGTADVAVRNPDTPAAILPDAFSYVEAPTITEVTPRRGPLDGGTRVTITGTGFTDEAVVTIGDVTLTDVRVIDDTTIRVVMPPASRPITVSIRVTNPGQPVAVARRAFTYRGPAAEPTPTPSPTQPALLPRCASFRASPVSTDTGAGLVLTDADLFPAGRDIRSPRLVDAGLSQGTGSISWQPSPPRIEWQAPAGEASSATITFAYESRSCRGFGTGTITVTAR